MRERRIFCADSIAIFLEDIGNTSTGKAAMLVVREQGRTRLLGNIQFIVTTVEKRYKVHHQRKEQKEEFFSKSVSARPRIFQWD